MKASQFFISTLKDAPADAEVTSQKLMLRAGMIKRLAAGVYSYMPLGLRVIRKVEAIIRDEMNRAGAIELLMPVVQPAELWQESNRYQDYGPELLRFKDRHDRDFVIQPTSEEVITDIARKELRSYKQLPINFYHIQTKFRDEIRPRFGVMRGREFTMKDAYSFDKDTDGMKKSYQRMYDAYVRIFNRLGLQFRAVDADTGSIGGTGSHEFHVIAETGEDEIAYCPQSNFAANIEKAPAPALLATRATATESLEKVATPTQSKCEDVAELLGLPLHKTVKAVVLAADTEFESGIQTKIFLLLVRGDHEVNEIKVNKLPGLEKNRMATEAEILKTFASVPGFLGPIGIASDVTVIADLTVANMSDFVCGANEKGFHYRGVNWGRDLAEPTLITDIRNVVAGDASPDGAGALEICRGIEVGHVFQLGTKYSQALNATFLDETGRAQPFVMGCYGVGVTRIVGAAIEQNNDDKGIIWPESIAPWQVVLCPIGYEKSALVKEATDNLYHQLCAANIDVLLDDRGERPGVMFADMELIGVPHRITLGERGLKEQQVEYQSRRHPVAEHKALSEIGDWLIAHFKSM